MNAKAGAFAYANRRKQAGSLCYIAFWLAMLLSERETLERVLESVQSPAVEEYTDLGMSRQNSCP